MSDEGVPRRVSVKKTFLASKKEDLRRQRNELSVELRKIKKVDNLSKRRNMVQVTCDDDDDEEENTEEKIHTDNSEDPLEELLAGIIQTEDIQHTIKCTKAIRRILSRVKTPPIDKVLKAGFGPYLVNFLSADSSPQLQFEATWSLTNIASGDSTQTRTVVRLGAVPHFIRLLSSKHRNLAEQAVWALGNIAGDGSDLRDCVIRAGCITPILNLIHSNCEITFIRNLTWTLSNLCRNKNPNPDIESIKRILPALKSLLQHEDDDVKSDACWAISYVTDGANDKIDLVLEYGIVQILINILHKTSDSKLLAPALRSLGNIVTGSDDNTQFVMDCGLLLVLGVLLEHPKCTIQKESAWTLSNILAGTQMQITQVFNSNLLPQVIRMTTSSDIRTQKEISWIYSNISTGGNPTQIFQLFELGCIDKMAKLLLVKDTKLVLIVLETLLNFLKTGKEHSELSFVEDAIEESGALDAIESLQDHKCNQIYSQVSNILENYFVKSDDESINEEVEFVEVIPKINEKTGQFEILTVEEIENKNVEFNF